MDTIKNIAMIFANKMIYPKIKINSKNFHLNK